ncbi:peptidoglycan-binding domain-containing protein [Pseudomonas japonica]|uniref:peptidoglycan-binding domain-containing protein n=1 Tax=Pseudomonas japonica TaxID=256466 RepID=UPI0037F254B8
MALRHEIVQGDSVASLAAEHGFFPETLWDHPENAELKTLRASMNVLAPGDVLYIPDKRESHASCATGQRHVFRRRAVPMLFSIQLLDGRSPRANLPYRLELEALTLEGQTSADGRIERYIPNATRRGRLRVGDGVVDALLDFGHMDPADLADGLRKRLRNLGYRPRDGAEDPDGLFLRAELSLFQANAGLPVTGEDDADTRAALARNHDEAGVYQKAAAPPAHTPDAP